MKYNKISNMCDGLKPSACIEYEGDTNAVSPLKNDCALTIQETTEDIYNQLEEINLEELEDSILNYVKTEDGRVIVKNAFIKIDAEIIALKERVTELETTDICNKSLESCGIEVGSLVDSCGEQPLTLKDHLQLIYNTLND